MENPESVVDIEHSDSGDIIGIVGSGVGEGYLDERDSYVVCGYWVSSTSGTSGICRFCGS